jgi:hypothetical protein
MVLEDNPPGPEAEGADIQEIIIPGRKSAKTYKNLLFMACVPCYYNYTPYCILCKGQLSRPSKEMLRFYAHLADELPCVNNVIFRNIDPRVTPVQFLQQIDFPF